MALNSANDLKTTLKDLLVLFIIPKNFWRIKTANGLAIGLDGLCWHMSAYGMSQEKINRISILFSIILKLTPTNITILAKWLTKTISMSNNLRATVGICVRCVCIINLHRMKRQKSISIRWCNICIILWLHISKNIRMLFL